MTKFKTPYNDVGIDEVDLRYEKNNGVSITTPGQSMSVQDLITRFQSGLNLTNSKIPIYYNDEIYPDLRTMDISEKYEYLERTKQTVKELTAKYKAQQRDAAQRAKDAERVRFNTDDQGNNVDLNNNPDPDKNFPPKAKKQNNNNKNHQKNDDE